MWLFTLLVVASLSVKLDAAPPGCEFTEMDKCINDDILVYVNRYSMPANDKEFQESCANQKRGLACGDEYVKRCFDGIRKGVVALVLDSMKSETNERCDAGSPGNKQYFKHIQCLNSLGHEINRCARWAVNGMYHVAHNVAGSKQINTICCYFPQMVRCVKDAVKPKCGEEASKYAETFLEAWSKEILDFACARKRGKSCQEGVERITSLLVNELVAAGYTSDEIAFHEFLLAAFRLKII